MDSKCARCGKTVEAFPQVFDKPHCWDCTQLLLDEWISDEDANAALTNLGYTISDKLPN